MACPQRYEGTWDEVSAELSEHADELRAFGRIVLIVEPREDGNDRPTPNKGMLAALREIQARQADRPFTDGSDSMRLLREARAGAMYGYDPTD